MDAPRLHEHPLLAALLACALLASACSAQPATPQQQGSSDYATDQEMRVSTTMIALLAAVIAVFVLIAASIIYLRHCTGGHSYAHAARPSDRAAPAADVSLSTFLARRLRRQTRGLDAGVVEAFPTMRYAEAKALRVGKTKAVAALECAVCLSEFEDDERLRLLPRCSHAFHPDCIGEWLASHVTCPVCRCNLDPTKDTGSHDEPTNNPPPPAPEANSTSSEIAVVRRHEEQEDGAGPVPAAVVIDVLTDEEAEQRRKEALELQRIGTQRRAMRSRPKAGKKLVRSHSTGHSLAVVQLDRDLERFTLRLPEHLRREMIAAGEQSSRRGQRGGEGSSRGSRLGRSGNWPSSFLRYTRTLSGRFFSGTRRTDSSEGGEVSSSSSTRIRGKRVAAVDFADGSAVGSAKVGSVAVDVDTATSRQVRT